MPDTPPRAGSGPSLLPPSHLQQELQAHEALLHAQTKMVQRYLDAQGAQLAESLVQRARRRAFPCRTKW